MSERWCKVCDGWHSLEEPWPSACVRHHNDKASDLPSPMIISDHLDNLQSQSDGKIYTSKRALRRSYREQGMVEIGNEKQVNTVREKTKIKGVITALEKAAARVERGERTERFKRKNP